MSIPITINKLLNDNIVEWARIEFKEGWNPDTTLKTISAFANDIDNWGCLLYTSPSPRDN